jgi:hypothetical protein
MSKLCDICGDVFFCEHQQERVKISLAIKKWFEEQDESECIERRQRFAEQEQLKRCGYIIPDDRDITGSD